MTGDDRLRSLERKHAQGDELARVLLLEELRRLERPLVDPKSGIELVFVPGGEVECEGCGGLIKKQSDCAACGATGRRKFAPFYLGRYPVTWREWLAYVVEAVPVALRRPGGPWSDQSPGSHHPVTHVSHADALAFCTWTGLRLPSSKEWNWAALGPPFGSAARPCPGDGITCSHAHNRPPLFPWGDAPPTPDVCVWARMGGGYAVGPAGTRPVVRPIDGKPSRPLGASWCGAHDMAGNVWEWTSEGGIEGGSFRIEYLPFPRPANLDRVRAGRAGGHPDDDIGFRVAFSMT